MGGRNLSAPQQRIRRRCLGIALAWLILFPPLLWLGFGFAGSLGGAYHGLLPWLLTSLPLWVLAYYWWHVPPRQDGHDGE